MATEWNAPFIPFDFRIILPHHLAQDEKQSSRAQSGAYIREGKSYSRLWVHAIHEGTKTRFWTSNGSSIYQQGATIAFVQPYPGEEYARTQSSSWPGSFNITRSLTNPLEPQYDYSQSGEPTPWDASDAQDDARSLFRGCHVMPARERKLAARGITLEFYVRWGAEKIRFLGYGGEYGPGPHNMYYSEPEYPYPEP